MSERNACLAKRKRRLCRRGVLTATIRSLDQTFESFVAVALKFIVEEPPASRKNSTTSLPENQLGAVRLHSDRTWENVVLKIV